MSTPGEKLQIPLDDALLIFRDLEEYVVSFDRILSRIGAGADPVTLIDYLADRDIPSRLARARGIMGELLEERIGAEAVDEIAENGYVYTDDVGREGRGSF